MPKPIHIHNLSLSLPHKICFEDFSIQIPDASRIAIIGRNGSGKTSLLKILMGYLEPSSGDVQGCQNLRIGFVPQIIENNETLSGAERFNQALTQALSLDPQLLLLDEPTNHLDRHQRSSLLRLLTSYSGTLILVSHDHELLQTMETFWHIDQGKIHVFSGDYEDYLQDRQRRRMSIEKTLSQLNKQKKDTHTALMKEQQRAAKSKAKGEKSIAQSKWPTVVSTAKAARAEETSGGKKSAIQDRKHSLQEQAFNLRLPEIIIPQFSIPSSARGDHMILSIANGAVAYVEGKPLLQDINVSLKARERISLQGANGSGKSTVLKAILDDAALIRSGDWIMLKPADIGYLDQHYASLAPEKTVFEIIAECLPHESAGEQRRHLNDFLFRKNEEVNVLVRQLSGGEKARLCLAQIAARLPKLLILDEISNNLDLETREHMIEVLKDYPSAMIIVSHDEDFLKAIGVEQGYQLVKGRLFRV